MKKNDAFSYDVRHNEKITIKVTARNFGDSLISVRAELDGDVSRTRAQHRRCTSL